MSLVEQIKDWKEYPNSLGSEAAAAVLVADVATALRKPIPRDVLLALRQLALRGTLRDLAQELRGSEVGASSASFHDAADIAAASAGLSWTEAITVIVLYLNKAAVSLSPRRTKKRFRRR